MYYKHEFGLGNCNQKFKYKSLWKTFPNRLRLLMVIWKLAAMDSSHHRMYSFYSLLSIKELFIHHISSGFPSLWPQPCWAPLKMPLKLKIHYRNCTSNYFMLKKPKQTNPQEKKIMHLRIFETQAIQFTTVSSKSFQCKSSSKKKTQTNIKSVLLSMLFYFCPDFCWW